MTFLITLFCTVLAVCILREPIKRVPWLFYLLAVALVVLYFAAGSIGLPQFAQMAMLTLMRKCMLPFALFVFVMYVGVLPKGSAARKLVQPLRAPVSIVACILVLVHMVQYFMVYAPKVVSGVPVAGNVMASFVIAIALFALLAVLGVTSFDFVKGRMSTKAWRRVQQFAYLFYALTYVHLMVMLAPSAARGSAAAIEGVVVYTVVFGAYLVLRLMRAKTDKAD